VSLTGSQITGTCHPIALGCRAARPMAAPAAAYGSSACSAVRPIAVPGGG